MTSYQNNPYGHSGECKCDHKGCKPSATPSTTVSTSDIPYLKERYGEFVEHTLLDLERSIRDIVRKTLRTLRWRPEPSKNRWHKIRELSEIIRYYGLTNKRCRETLQPDPNIHPFLEAAGKRIYYFLKNPTNPSMRKLLNRWYGSNCDGIRGECMVCIQICSWGYSEFSKYCIELLNKEVHRQSGSAEYTVYDLVNYEFSVEQIEAIQRFQQGALGRNCKILNGIHPAFPTAFLAMRAWELQTSIMDWHNSTMGIFKGGDVHGLFQKDRFFEMWEKTK